MNFENLRELNALRPVANFLAYLVIHNDRWSIFSVTEDYRKPLAETQRVQKDKFSLLKCHEKLPCG